MKLAFLFGLISMAAMAAEPGWRTWPAGRTEQEASVRIPPGFKPIAATVPKSERTLLNGRFRSADGAVEFAVAATYVREAPRNVKARSIPLPLGPGEVVKTRKPVDRTVQSPAGEYALHEEFIVVEGAKSPYTRYFHLEVPLHSFPGAAAVLWEFTARDEAARARYQAWYRTFKESLNLGED
jgi:hypothetical protein